MRLLNRLEILPLALTSARIAVDIEYELKRKGKNINLVNILIAAIVIENRARLVTRDENYKNIGDLEVEFY